MALRHRRGRYFRLAEDESGQTLGLLLFLSVTLCICAVFLVNLGLVLSERTREQNAVDSAALSTAACQQRLLNTIAATSKVKTAFIVADALSYIFGSSGKFGESCAFLDSVNRGAIAADYATILVGTRAYADSGGRNEVCYTGNKLRELLHQRRVRDPGHPDKPVFRLSMSECDPNNPGDQGHRDPVSDWALAKDASGEPGGSMTTFGGTWDTLGPCSRFKARIPRTEIPFAKTLLPARLAPLVVEAAAVPYGGSLHLAGEFLEWGESFCAVKLVRDWDRSQRNPPGRGRSSGGSRSR